MNFGKYTLVNGTFILSDDYQLSGLDLKALNFTERFRSIRTQLPFFNETLELIRYKLELYNQTFPEFTNNDGAELKRQLERTLAKNKHYLGAILYFTIRFAGNKIHWSVQSEKLSETVFELNDKGLYIFAFEEIQKPVSAISNLSLGSEIYWNLAIAQLKDRVDDRILILNPENHVLEVPESNIYTIKGNLVSTPHISDGAYADISQPKLFDAINRLNLKFSDETPLTIETVLESDEVFIMNAIEGIRWIVGFEGKRYFNTTTRKINDMLNRQLV
ncbi:MAG: aminotransferase class IV [Prolixibacteraceae bacterium]